MIGTYQEQETAVVSSEPTSDLRDSRSRRRQVAQGDDVEATRPSGDRLKEAHGELGPAAFQCIVCREAPIEQDKARRACYTD